MKRALQHLIIATLICASAFAGALIAQTQAVTTARAHLPTIRNGVVVATICDGSAPILDQDTGSLSAIRDADGRYIVAYQDRAHGSLAHVAQHVGAGLEEVTAPPIVLAAMPAFSPDGVKQGSLALVPSNVPGGMSRLYYTQRKPNDDTGPYGIWCLEF